MALRIRLLELAEDVRGSYWFVPGLLAVGGLAAGLGLVLLDARLGESWLGRFEWFYGSRPEGARAVLATIASSTITVAGVVFSITLAAVTYASGQYGPRLLANFQRDRGNQVTLGTFVATFLYCLIVLRTIRSAEEASADSGGALREAFVPHLAVYGALALAVASIAVLVYFVHHVTDGIHINNVIARIGHRLLDDVGRLPDAAPASEAAAPDFDGAIDLPATRTGYIEAIDEDELLRLAKDHRVAFRLAVRPGDFVSAGQTLVAAAPASAVEPALTEGANSAFVFGRKRTPLQDLRFGIDELVEIAARALSPGVNDPFTAFACIDWLGSVVAALALRQPAAATRVDADGSARLVSTPLAFEDFLTTAFGRLRPYAARDPNARAHAAHTLDVIGGRISDPARRALVRRERERLLDVAA